jgi:hypothetical protein
MHDPPVGAELYDLEDVPVSRDANLLALGARTTVPGTGDEIRSPRSH